MKPKILDPHCQKSAAIDFFFFDLRDIFREFNVPERTGYRIIQQGASCRRISGTETRGRKRKVTEIQIEKADNILQDEIWSWKESDTHENS